MRPLRQLTASELDEFEAEFDAARDDVVAIIKTRIGEAATVEQQVAVAVGVLYAGTAAFLATKADDVPLAVMQGTLNNIMGDAWSAYAEQSTDPGAAGLGGRA